MPTLRIKNKYSSPSSMTFTISWSSGVVTWRTTGATTAVNNGSSTTATDIPGDSYLYLDFDISAWGSCSYISFSSQSAALLDLADLPALPSLETIIDFNYSNVQGDFSEITIPAGPKRTFKFYGSSGLTYGTGGALTGVGNDSYIEIQYCFANPGIARMFADLAESSYFNSGYAKGFNSQPADQSVIEAAYDLQIKGVGVNYNKPTGAIVSIDDVDELEGIGTNATTLALDFILGKDFDFYQVAYTRPGTVANPFAGTLDAKHHWVYNYAEAALGIIGEKTSGASITNLTLSSGPRLLSDNILGGSIL